MIIAEPGNIATTETSELTISELEELCKKCFAKKREIEELEEQIKSLNQEFEDIKNVLLLHLTELEKSSYDSAIGKVTVKNIFTVANPKTPEARKAFFDYLKIKGIFEDMISVHSKTLNSFYKEEMRIAQEEGQLSFSIPGLDEPFYKQTLSLTKKK